MNGKQWLICCGFVCCLDVRIYCANCFVPWFYISHLNCSNWFQQLQFHGEYSKNNIFPVIFRSLLKENYKWNELLMWKTTRRFSAWTSLTLQMTVRKIVSDLVWPALLLVRNIHSPARTFIQSLSEWLSRSANQTLSGLAYKSIIHLTEVTDRIISIWLVKQWFRTVIGENTND